jgi:hypothetical protein
MTAPARPRSLPARSGPRAGRRAGALLGTAFLAAFGFLLGSAVPVVACSCAMPGPLAEAATADQAVFSGTAGLRQERGVPVEVERWFWGRGAAPVVWLAARSFGDGASCGIDTPPPGSRWIWLTWLPDDGGDPLAGLCSPHAMLDTPEGEAMLAEAIAAFSDRAPPSQPAEPTPEAPPPTAGPFDPAVADRDATVIAIGAAVTLASLGLFGGLVLLARRQSRGG